MERVRDVRDRGHSALLLNLRSVCRRSATLCFSIGFITILCGFAVGTLLSTGDAGNTVGYYSDVVTTPETLVLLMAYGAVFGVVLAAIGAVFVVVAARSAIAAGGPERMLVRRVRFALIAAGLLPLILTVLGYAATQAEALWACTILLCPLALSPAVSWFAGPWTLRTHTAPRHEGVE